MSKEIYISSTPHETRLAIVEDEALTEIYYERENEYTLAGSIYNGRVTRVLPGMQSSFVDIGLERDAFLYITDFMEEAPDPEEFDTASNGDRAPRTPRPNGGERPDESGAPAIRTESSGRNAERGDRGGRGRRGGRDRDRNPDRGSERQAGSDRTPSERERGEAPHIAPANVEPGAAAPGDLSDSADAGEGAPGADANRRWRGRRGRRRGRGTSGQPGDPVQENAAPSYPADDSSVERESYMEIDAAAPATVETVDRMENSPRTSRPGDRGPRDGQRRDGQRHDGQRSDTPRRDQPRNEPRAPRGFAPSRDLYGVDSGASSATGPIANAYPDAEAGAGAEPIILPGESLSKYRKGDDPAGTAPPATSGLTGATTTTVTLAPPANLYTIAEGWDGGATLPGETLSRRRPADSRNDSPRSFEREPRREGRGDRSETRRDNRSSFRNAPPVAEPVAEPAASVAPTETLHETIAPSAAEVPEVRDAVSSSVPEAVARIEQAPAPAHAEVEYEPAEASVSYRVDPLPRSEYRQSAPTLEPPAEFAGEPPAPSVESSVPEPAEASAPPVIAASPEAAAHDITAISAGGEMFSEPLEVVAEAPSHPAPIEVSEPASPIRHEGAVRSDPDAEFLAPGIGMGMGVGIGVGTGTGDFAPGSGQLAEEILEDEDSYGTTLHASSIEEIDDLEEETLEGAADLGTMLREMSIDHITRTMPEVEEEDAEDDFEEDDLEEDDDEEGEEEDDDSDDADESGHSEEDFQEQAARSGSPADAEFSERQSAQQSAHRGEDTRSQEQSSSAPSPSRDPSRDSDRRGGRRDGRRGRSDRGDRNDRGDRSRSGRTGHGGSSSGGHGRHSMQSTNLPAISDLLKPGQEILVQIAKEPIAKKGARITSHIALPGRFLVFMPTVNHTGVSRKIESDGERRRLKEILLSEKGEATGGFIVRTAAEGASEEELRSDLRFLLNLWADIKNRSESSKSPALIYHDLNLVERILRDQVTDNFSAIWVDTEDAYERVLRFLQRFQPSLIRRVKLYLKDTPLFEQFGITEEINKALRSKVWLKSGGSIVINQTEALVAIDINTGKFVGKTARLEDTIVKTNLDAIPEIVRQIRLRDLGGIIIIDFIDMDERKNRNRVMAALEDELKSDRAPSKVLQFNDFGLVAITRKRVKQSLERTLSTTCTICTGTGMVKSPVTVCNDIYIEMRKMHKHLDRGDVMLRVHPEVVKQLKSSGAKWLQEMEEMAGKTILVKSDPSLHPEQFDIH